LGFLSYPIITKGAQKDDVKELRGPVYCKVRALTPGITSGWNQNPSS